jgi:hypothetical protein
MEAVLVESETGSVGNSHVVVKFLIELVGEFGACPQL